MASLLLTTTAELKALPPQIEYPPRAETVILYEQAAFGVIASGAPPLTYQWLKDGVPIPGAHSDQLILAQCRFGDAGRYSVVLGNGEGSVTSPVAALTVNPPRAGDVDFSFKFEKANNGNVHTILVQPDGRILVGGNFSALQGAVRSSVTRLHANGTTDHTFRPDTGGESCFLGHTVSLAVAPDGEVLVSGFLIGGSCLGSRPGLMKLKPDGSRNEGYRPDLTGWDPYLRLAVQRDGRVLVAGRQSQTVRIARLDHDGGFDGSWSGATGAAVSGGDYPSAMAVQSDDKVLFAGGIATATGHGRIVRFNADGSMDSTFTTVLSGHEDGTQSWFDCIAPSGDSGILVGGAFTLVNGIRRTSVALLNLDGTVAERFLPVISGGYATVSAIALQPDGKVLIGGHFTTVNGVVADGLARLNADGTLDTGFQHGGSWDQGELPHVWSVRLQPDGKILVGGSFDRLKGVSCSRIARLNPDGSFDFSFHRMAGTEGFVEAIAIQPDSRIVLGGNFSSISGAPAKSVARLDPDGAMDPGFQSGQRGVEGNVLAVTCQPDGRTLIGGDFRVVNGAYTGAYARLHTDGTLDMGFRSVILPYDHVSSIAVQDDGKVLVGGTLADDGGTGLASVARFNPNGTMDVSFAHALPDVGAFLASLAIQPDGDVLVLGSEKLVRLNTNGNPDATFRELPIHPRGGGAVAVQPDGKVLVGAWGVRLHPDGQVDGDFKVQTDGWEGGSPPYGRPSVIRAIVVQNDGRILIGGRFTGVNGVPRSNVARLHADGTVDHEFHAGASGEVRSMAVQSDGRILIAGYFGSINGVPLARLARLWGSAEVPPRMKAVHRQGRELSLTWEGLPSRRYRVQYSQSLSGADWVNLGDDVTSSAGGLATIADTIAGGAPQRFYRVVLLP